MICAPRNETMVETNTWFLGVYWGNHFHHFLGASAIPTPPPGASGATVWLEGACCGWWRFARWTAGSGSRGATWRLRPELGSSGGSSFGAGGRRAYGCENGCVRCLFFLGKPLFGGLKEAKRRRTPFFGGVPLRTHPYSSFGLTSPV